MKTQEHQNENVYTMRTEMSVFGGINGEKENQFLLSQKPICSSFLYPTIRGRIPTIAVAINDTIHAVSSIRWKVEREINPYISKLK